MIHPDLKLPHDEIAEFCRRHHIKTLSLVGSATRGDFRPDSDVDFLTEFDPEVSIGLAKYLDMEEKLAGIVGRPVDLIERKTIEQSRNYIRSKHILSNLEPVYVVRWCIFLDILLAAKDVQEFAEGLTWGTFTGSKLHQHAIVRALEIIGEAASKIRSNTAKSTPRSPAYSTAQKELHQQERLSRRYKEGRKDLSWLSLSRYIQQLMPCEATIALYTKFIEAKREHKCEKTQVSPALPDTMERGRGARGHLNMLGISKVRRERQAQS